MSGTRVPAGAAPSREAKSALRACVAAQSRLRRKLEEATATPPVLPGYERNVFGTYWRRDLVDALVALGDDAVARIPDRDESFSIACTRAALLAQARRFDEAEQRLLALLTERPANASVLQMLACTQAYRGDLAAARAYAGRLHALPSLHPFHRIPEGELEKAFRSANP